MTFFSECFKDLIEKRPARTPQPSEQTTSGGAPLARPHGPPTPPPHPLNPFFRDALPCAPTPGLAAHAARRQRASHERQACVPVRSHFGEHVPDEPPPSYEASTAGGSISAGMLPTSISAHRLESSHCSQSDDMKQDDLRGYRHKRYYSNGRDPRLTATHRTPGAGKHRLSSAVLHAMSPSLPPSTLATLAQLNKACYSVVIPYLYQSITISRLALDALMWGVDLPELDGSMYRPFDRTVAPPPTPPLQTPPERRGILQKRNKGKGPARQADTDEKDGFEGFGDDDIWSKPRVDGIFRGGLEPTLETKRRKARLLELVKEIRLDGLVPDVRLCRAIATLPLAPPRQAEATSSSSLEDQALYTEANRGSAWSISEKRRSHHNDKPSTFEKHGKSKEAEAKGDLLPHYNNQSDGEKRSQSRVHLPVPLFPNVQKVIVDATYLDTLALWTVKACANPLSRTSATFRHHPFLSALLRLVPRSATFIFLSLNNDYRRATDVASSMHQITLMVAHSSSFKQDTDTLLGSEAAQTGGVKKVILNDVDGNILPAFGGVERVEIHTLAQDDAARLDQFLQLLYFGDGPGTSQFFGKGLNPEMEASARDEASGLIKAERARLRLRYGPERLETFAWS